MVRILLSAGAKVDLQLNGVEPPLLLACCLGHIEMVHALLSAGAKVNQQDDAGVSPMHMAVQQGNTVLVHALLSAGAKVDLRRSDGTTPLLSACFLGHKDAACALLSAGAKVDLHSTSGMSPLNVACQGGHMEVIRVLLSAGVQADLRAVNGMTPLDALPTGLRPEVEQLVRRAREDRGKAKMGASTAGVPPADFKPAGQAGGEGSSVGCDWQPAVGGGRSGRAVPLRVCSMCGGGPPSASSSDGANLKVCGCCRSVWYCLQECQKKHWGRGGHKAACPLLREARERRGGAGAGD